METNIKFIDGYLNLYSITTDGRIFSHKTEKWLKCDIRKGYLYTVLYKDKKRYCATVHRLVALNFIKKVIGKRHVNHLNGNKLDNRVENLEWCTSGENQRHAINSGLKKPLCGSNNGASKLSEEDIIAIRNNITKNQRELAKEFNISYQQISRIIRNERWKHI